MAPKNLLGKAVNVAIGSIRHPWSTTGKVIGQAKGTAVFGTKVAKSVTSEAAGVVFGKGKSPAGRTVPVPPSQPGGEPPTTLRSVPDVNEPAHVPAGRGSFEDGAGAAPTAHQTEPAQKVAQKTPEEPVAKKAVVPEPPTKKAAAKKAPARKSADRKSAGRKSTAKKRTAKKGAAKKGAAKKGAAEKVSATPADVAEVVEAAVAEDPSQTAATEAGFPAEKRAAAKRPAKKAATRKAATESAGPGPDVKTPAGTTAAGAGVNPDTAEGGLDQPGTEGIVEPSTAKEVVSESDALRKAAERNPE